MEIDSQIKDLQKIKDQKERIKVAWQIVEKNPKLVRYIAKKTFYFVDDDSLSDARIILLESLLYANPDKGSLFTVINWKATPYRQCAQGVYVPIHIRVRVRAWLKKGKNILDPNLDLGDQSQESRLRLAWLLWHKRKEIPDIEEVEDPQEEPKEFGPDIEKVRAYLEYLESQSPIRKDAILKGLDDDDPCSLQDIANRYGYSRERIRQIQGEEMLRLRRLLEGPDKTR